MRIKFLETCSSDNPSYPFQAGQIVELTGRDISPGFRSYIKRGQAVILPDDETERAVAPVAERPEPEPVKGPNKRADKLDKR